MEKKVKFFITVGIFSSVVLLAALGSYGVSTVGTKEFTRQLGAVASVTASVAANPYNTLAQALSNKEKDLNAREAAIAAKEAAAMADQQNIFGGRDGRLAALVLAIGLLLLSLILFNFYLDWRRSGKV